MLLLPVYLPARCLCSATTACYCPNIGCAATASATTASFCLCHYCLLLPNCLCYYGMLLPNQCAATACYCQVIVLQHLDVTSKQEEAHEGKQLAQLTEASLALLELIFPRHIIEYMTNEAASASSACNITDDGGESAAAAAAPQGQVQPAVTKVSVASACLSTLRGRDYKRLTTRHEQVRPPS